MYREENQDKQRCLPNLKRQGGGSQMTQSHLYSQVCIFYCKKKKYLKEKVWVRFKTPA